MSDEHRPANLWELEVLGTKSSLLKSKKLPRHPLKIGDYTTLIISSKSHCKKLQER